MTRLNYAVAAAFPLAAMHTGAPPQTGRRRGTNQQTGNHEMKKRLSFAVSLAAMIIATMAAAETPKDTVVMAKQIDDIISLDPGELFEISGGEVAANIYDTLLASDPDDISKIVGRLAESWSAEPDGLTYSFKLHDGLKFASGNSVTADDAAYSLQRAVIMNKTPGFILTQFRFTKDNAKERIRATDRRTLVLVTEKQVAPSFLYYCLTSNVGSVVDSKVVQEHVKDADFGNQWLKTNSAGSGPYNLRSWRPNESYTLEANDNYWGKKALTKRVVVRHIAEPSAQRLLLETGDVDYARNLTRDQVDALKGNPDITTQATRTLTTVYLGLNQKNQYLSKPEVREALKYLVDYDAMEKTILADAFVVHQAFLPTGLLGAIDDRPYKFDLAKARELLAAAKLDKGFTVTMDVQGESPWTDIAQAIQASFGQAGIKVDIIAADRRQMVTKYRARNHEIVLTYWAPDYPDPHSNAQGFAMSFGNTDNPPTKTLAWRNYWEIPDLTKRSEAAVAERDSEKRAAMYEALQREHQKVSPFVLMFQKIAVLAHRKSADGLILPIGLDPLYAGIVKH